VRVYACTEGVQSYFFQTLSPPAAFNKAAFSFLAILPGEIKPIMKNTQPAPDKLPEMHLALEALLEAAQYMLDNDDKLPEGAESVRKIAQILYRYHEGTILLADLYSRMIVQNIGLSAHK
jgi:hypothetical protein